jgi:hypothetical protein
MFGLKTLYARHLSRKGEHAAALAMCDLKDVYVLSRAGMHLSVLSACSKRCLELASAQFNVGDIDGALSMLRQFRHTREARPLIGQLAILIPEHILPLTVDHPQLVAIRRYCELALGRARAEEAAGDLPTPLHSVAQALSEGDATIAHTQWNRFFNDYGLLPPEMNWETGKLDLRHIGCVQPADVIQQGSLISIIMTAFNEEAYLETAVRSILNQTWKNLELIIVDDCSADGTNQLAVKLGHQDSRIKLVTLDHNVGTWQSKNAGLELARGEYITMHDADDWSHPSKLQMQMEPLLSQPKLMCSSSYFVRVQQETGSLFTRNACSYMRWNPSSLLYRRAAFLELGGYHPNLVGGDCEYAARIETRWGRRVHAVVRKPLALGWQRNGSLSNRFRSPEDVKYRLEQWEHWRTAQAFAYKKRDMSLLRVSKPTLFQA